MRMRLRSNLQEKMSACNEWLAIYEGLNFYARTEEEKYDIIDCKKLFGNDNPVYLEIGCGKGDFIIKTALEHPEINFLALEKISNVIILGLKRAYDMRIPNLRFINCNAQSLCYYLNDDTISRIYLNFSCPYPKGTYKNHRLTNKRFLDIYKRILIDGSEIWQKTDNMHFFEYSLTEFSKCGFIITEVQLDLHHSNFEGNILTEYETKFSEMGMPIYRLVARYEQNNKELSD